MLKNCICLFRSNLFNRGACSAANFSSYVNKNYVVNKNAPLIANSFISLIDPLKPGSPVTYPKIVPLQIDNPAFIKPSILDQINIKEIIDDPLQREEKQAVRLIVIRRRKMKRHRLKKLRIKMKFEWAKLRQRREMKKEKAFQAELMGQIREAKKFNAAAYASEKLKTANEVMIPKRWKGKRLPEFVIIDLLEKKKNKIEERKESIKRRKQIDLIAANYKYS